MYLDTPNLHDRIYLLNHNIVLWIEVYWGDIRLRRNHADRKVSESVELSPPIRSVTNFDKNLIFFAYE